MLNEGEIQAYSSKVLKIVQISKDFEVSNPAKLSKSRPK